jgi:predicted negative regulator of RcsB-dependent stress response
MDAVGNWKWLEAGTLLAAGVAFGWWQLRDVKRAQAETQRRKAHEQTNKQAQSASPPSLASPPTADPASLPQVRPDPKEGPHA